MTATCPECESIHEYQNSDIKSRWIHRILGGHDAHYYIVCLNCKKDIKVPRPK